MNELTLKQEAALAIAWAHQNEGSKIFTDLDISRAFASLEKIGMIRIQTSMNQKLVLFQGMLPLGLKHYDRARKERRSFIDLSDEADRLILYLAAQDEVKRENGNIPLVTGNFDDTPTYQELSDNGLIDAQWTNDILQTVQITDKGRSYAEGRFQNQMNNESININVSPVFNNNSSAQASSVSDSTSNTVIKDITLDATIKAIADLNIDEALKREIESVVRELAVAAEAKNKVTFLDKLEKLVSIASNLAELAPILFAFMPTPLKTILT